jgi:murein DD-endopeptidase MepM/ murein hydrolase activator NlpD
MARHYTVIVIDDKGSPVRETIISKKWIGFISILIAAFLAFISIGSYRYINLRQAALEKLHLIGRLDEQQNKLEEQRRQIQSFAENINELKAKLAAIHEFENKIRIIANLEHKADQASLFAIGGAIPEDLDTEISSKENPDHLMREMHEQIGQIKQVSTVQGTSLQDLLQSLEGKRNLLASTPSLRPAQGWISSDFGYRVSPFTGRREFHKGLDIANREGTSIIAPADGVITFADNKWLIGNMVVIDHGHGISTRYGHLKKIIKKKGERVKRGDIIALMGNTGRSTGPHVHYEVRLNGVQVNPMQYILD